MEWLVVVTVWGGTEAEPQSSIQTFRCNRHTTAETIAARFKCRDHVQHVDVLHDPPLIGQT
jgi:hypothetical protein